MTHGSDTIKKIKLPRVSHYSRCLIVLLHLAVVSIVVSRHPLLDIRIALPVVGQRKRKNIQ